MPQKTKQKNQDKFFTLFTFTLRCVFSVTYTYVSVNAKHTEKIRIAKKRKMRERGKLQKN